MPAELTCPLCGYHFDPAGLTCQAGCPLAAVQGCQLLCCPNCHYPIVDERSSKLAGALRRLWPAAPARGTARGGAKL
jgi:hypothetical protein